MNLNLLKELILNFYQTHPFFQNLIKTCGKISKSFPKNIYNLRNELQKLIYDISDIGIEMKHLPA